MDGDNLHDEKRHLEAATVQDVAPYANGSVQMAAVLVANLIVINAGGLLVFPAYLKDLPQLGTEARLNVANSATLFVFGLICSFLTGYIAYLNYQFHIRYRINDLYQKVGELEERHDEITKHRLAKWRTENSKELAESEKKHVLQINVSFWLGQIFGWLSVCFFIAACYYCTRTVMT
jgi:uncharacterized membrane protein YciS (DUF1049 family)